MSSVNVPVKLRRAAGCPHLARTAEYAKIDKLRRTSLLFCQWLKYVDLNSNAANSPMTPTMIGVIDAAKHIQLKCTACS